MLREHIQVRWNFMKLLCTRWKNTLRAMMMETLLICCCSHLPLSGPAPGSAGLCDSSSLVVENLKRQTNVRLWFKKDWENWWWFITVKLLVVYGLRMETKNLAHLYEAKFLAVTLRPYTINNFTVKYPHQLSQLLSNYWLSDSCFMISNVRL